MQKPKNFDLNTDTYRQRDDAREQIRRQIKCTDYLTKSKNGQYCCPFCGSGTGKNKTGAVKYYPATNTIACFAGCNDKGDKRGKSYDVIDLHMNARGIDYNTALKELAAAVGIDLEGRTYTTPKNDTPERPKNDFSGVRGESIGQSEKMAGATAEDVERRPNHTAYYKYCAEQLENPAAVSYLTARGISIETAKRCKLGYDPAADPATAPGAMGDEYKPHPAPRIIIPVTTAFYIGRRTDGITEFAKMNSAGGGSGIFGSSLLKTGASPIFVTEGAFDAMAIMEAGAEAVALNSTNNAGLFVGKLERIQNPPALVICLDNDDPGRKAAETITEAAERLKIPCINTNICGEHKDPNDALTADPAAFKQAIAQAIEDAEKAEPADYLTDFLDKIQTDAYKPYKTGLPFFDDLLGGGVIRQTMLLLLAAPGTGKTTLCQQIAEAMARNGKKVVYFNLEMPREQMIAKAISSRLAGQGYNMTALEIMQGYNWSDEQREKVTAEINNYRHEIAPYLTYNPGGGGSDLEQIRQQLEKLGQEAQAAGTEAPAVVLDYLHLVTTTERADAQELIKQTVVMLKSYAITYNSFVIAISATNRLSNTSGRLTMESARDSSNAEYTGDYMLSLNYYDIDNGTTDPKDAAAVAALQLEAWRRMIIRVLKGRLCAPGKHAEIYFRSAYNRFIATNEIELIGDEATPFNKTAAAEPADKQEGNGRNITASF